MKNKNYKLVLVFIMTLCILSLTACANKDTTATESDSTNLLDEVKNYTTFFSNADNYKDIACSNFIYDNNLLKANQEVDFAIIFRNSTSKNIKNVTATLEDNRGNTTQLGTLSKFQSGSYIPIQFSYKLPEDLTNYKLLLTLKSKDGYSDSELLFMPPDIKINTYSTGSVEIVNQGYSDAEDTIIYLYENELNGTILQKINVGTMAIGESLNLTVQIPKEYLTFGDISDRKFCYEVTNKIDEIYETNNLINFSVNEGNVNEVFTADEVSQDLIENEYNTEDKKTDAFTAEQTDDGAILLQWTPIQGVSGYILYMYMPSEGKDTVITTIKSQVNSFKVTLDGNGNEIKNNTLYKFKLLPYTQIDNIDVNINMYSDKHYTDITTGSSNGNDNKNTEN